MLTVATTNNPQNNRQYACTYHNQKDVATKRLRMVDVQSLIVAVGESKAVDNTSTIAIIVNQF